MIYSANWQLLQEDIYEDWSSGTPGDIDEVRQNVWGLRYIDDCIAHCVDDDVDSTHDNTWYHLTDVQFSTVAILDEDANLVENGSVSAPTAKRATTGHVTPMPTAPSMNNVA